jgi:dienelactone hydrolase
VSLRLASAAIAACVLASGIAQHAANADGRAPEIVRFPIASAEPNPLRLQGALRRPNGAGAFPAVVLLHGCDGDWRGLDERWGSRLAAWGYATLTVDSYGSRGIESTCQGRTPADAALDAFGALNFLAEQPFVAPSRIALFGVDSGGTVTLASVEPGLIEHLFKRKFRAAVAFYPVCGAFTGTTTAPALVLIGDADDWVPADACGTMAAQETDPVGISRAGDPGAGVHVVIYPGAVHGFDDPRLVPGKRVLGHWLEYNQNAAERAAQEVRDFLASTLDR